MPEEVAEQLAILRTWGEEEGERSSSPLRASSTFTTVSPLRRPPRTTGTCWTIAETLRPIRNLSSTSRSTVGSMATAMAGRTASLARTLRGYTSSAG